MSRTDAPYHGDFGSGDLSSGTSIRGIQRYSLSHSAGMDMIDSLMSDFRIKIGTGRFKSTGRSMTITAEQAEWWPVSLLPPNAADQERAIDLAIARLENIPAPLRTLWRPDECHSDLLPWLAWALSVDEWSDSWSDAVKRTAIAASMALHSTKGTPYAVKAALEMVGFTNVLIQEGALNFYTAEYSYDGEIDYGSDTTWPLFTVHLNAGRPNAETVALIRRMIDKYKNSRSVLENLNYAVLLYDATINYDGNDIYSGGIV